MAMSMMQREVHRSGCRRRGAFLLAGEWPLFPGFSNPKSSSGPVAPRVGRSFGASPFWPLSAFVSLYKHRLQRTYVVMIAGRIYLGVDVIDLGLLMLGKGHKLVERKCLKVLRRKASILYGWSLWSLLLSVGRLHLQMVHIDLCKLSRVVDGGQIFLVGHRRCAIGVSESTLGTLIGEIGSRWSVEVSKHGNIGHETLKRARKGSNYCVGRSEML